MFERKLAAILAADVEGYSRLMGADEVATLEALSSHREIMDSLIAHHRGRVANTAGDSVLAEFPSAVDAVQAAMAVQEKLQEANETLPAKRRVRFRIGIHVGDVMVRGGDLFGDAVNIAARLQTLSESGGVCVSTSVHEHVRKVLPVSFEDLGAQQVKNVAEPVRAFAVRSLRGPSPSPQVGSSQPLQLPDKPSIAVLPFDNMSSDPEQSFFGDGIAEDIITMLSSVSALFVIARNSTFSYKAKARDLREVGRELGVRYILEGSVRRSGDRIRVTAQLADTTTDSHIWAERYDRPVQDVFDIQDELTREIVTALRVVLTDGEQARMWQRSTENVNAWAEAMRGVDHVWRGTAADMETARKYLTAAVTRDPQYARGFAMLAITHYFDLRFGYTRNIEDAQRSLTKYAALALSLNAQEPYAVAVQATHLSFSGRFQEAVQAARLATEISPNDAFCWLVLARMCLGAELLEEGERAVRRAMRLNPFYPVNYLAVLADALVHQGRDTEALEVLASLVKRNPNYISAHLHLAGLHGQAGNWDAARAAVAEVQRINPAYRLEMARRFYLSADEERQERFVAALRTAGIPE